MQPFIQKHIPRKTADILGQDSTIPVLRRYISEYKSQKKKSILIYGPAGCGKTSSAYALAREAGYEIIEMNASDARNKNQINEIMGAASKQMSLFAKGKVILVEEVDGIAGRSDYGGISALTKLIKESSFPVIITANNPFDKKFTPLRNISEMCQFKNLETEDIYKILKNITKKEGIKHNDEDLKSVARRSGGDARAAINDLQMLSTENELKKNSLDELSQRDKIESMFSALIKIFKTTDADIAVKAFENVNEGLDQCLLWIDENLPKEYTNPEDLAEAYDKLSKVDVLYGRIRRRQHWRFLSHINTLLTAGIACSKKEKSKAFVKYKPTGRILKLWWAKQKNAKKKAIALKIAQHTHTSSKESLKSTLPYIKTIFEQNKGGSIAEQCDLNSDEIEWLCKRK
ncbi:replication factor C large subunit [Candidatus Woesearchaeota archaeon]|nr:replication factor C large subunit [Candidatus Woesearchaeota archaeon]